MAVPRPCRVSLYITEFNRTAGRTPWFQTVGIGEGVGIVERPPRPVALLLLVK